MGTFFAWVKRSVLGSTNRLTLRLTREQALALAREASKDDDMSSTLAMTMVREDGGKAIWIVSTPGVGRILEVEIEDATGQVLRVERVGFR